MLFSGIADTFRNEQFMGKYDLFYNLEKLLITANLNQLDREAVQMNMNIIFIYACLYCYSSFKDHKSKYKITYFSKPK